MKRRDVLIASSVGALIVGHAVATSVWASHASLAQSFPGGLLRIAAPPGTTAAYRDAAATRRLLIHAGEIVTAVPLDSPPGESQVYAQRGNEQLVLAYRIVAKRYPEQHLRLANPRHVEPNPDDVERIAREQRVIDGARDRFSERQPDGIDFAAPVRGRLSSPFGARRVLNGQPRNPHNGLDFAVPTGTPIAAPRDGTVAAVGDFFYTGHTVILDHGQGLTTMYCHLSVVSVKVGETLREGALIGKVGATGRATGPHLHWAVYFSNVPVDPTLVLRGVR